MNRPPQILVQLYQTRPIRLFGMWETGTWRWKVYGIAYGRNEPRPELVAAAKLCCSAIAVIS